MRFVVLSNRMRCLNQVAAVSVLAIIGAGCSSDFTRFDAAQYSSTVASDQSNNYQNSTYPGNVDPVTTSSINGSSVGGTRISRPPLPGGYVEAIGAPRQQLNPYPGDVNSGANAPVQLQASAARKPIQNYNTYNTYNTYQSAPIAKQAQAKLPKAASPKKYRAPSKPKYVDPITTSSLKPARRAAVNTNKIVKQPNLVAVSSPAESGWTGTGGTAITVRNGETLYNISKRYGVPVRELKRVNNITNADQVVSGQRIIIPTYIYSANVPVSAPDNNPKTRASRATTGMIGEVSQSNVGVPTKSPNGYSQNSYKPGLAPMSVARNQSQQASDGSRYRIVSGDSLGAIAGRHGVSLSDLKRANGLTGSNIQVGQTLIIPGKNSTPITQSQNKTVGLAPISVDKRVTGSTPKPYVKPGNSGGAITQDIDENAPARTGIDTFRWPATGRVMSKFGERRRGSRNDGIDISVPEGTSVKAAENGVVIYSDSELQEYGKLLLVRHAGGWVSAYAHNKTLNVKRGEKVRRGQVIAKSGRTGNAERPMIHFELRKDSNPVNPQKYLR